MLQTGLGKAGNGRTASALQKAPPAPVIMRARVPDEGTAHWRSALRPFPLS